MLKKKYKMYQLLIVLFILLSISFFQLCNWTSIYASQILGITSIFLFIIFSTYYKFKIKGCFKLWCLFFFLLCLINVLLSTLFYEQSFRDSISYASPYLIILLYFIIGRNINWKKKELIIKIIIIVSVIASIFFSIQALIFVNWNYNIFIDFNKFAKWTYRMGYLRIPYASYLVSIGIIFTFVKAIQTHAIGRKTILLLIIFTQIYYLLIWVKTRMLIICVIFTLLCLVSYQYYNKIYGIIIFLGIIGIVFLILTSDIGREYIDSFLSLKQDSSFSIRKREILFYLKDGLNSLLFGRGFLNETSGLINGISILRGESNMFYREDVGIIGLFHEFGLLGIIWYCGLVIKMVNIFSKTAKKNENKLLYFSIIIFLIISSFTLIITNSTRILYLVFFMIIFDDRKVCYKINEKHIYNIN